MRSYKKLAVILWILNTFLGLGIAGYAANAFVKKKTDYIKKVRETHAQYDKIPPPAARRYTRSVSYMQRLDIFEPKIAKGPKVQAINLAKYIAIGSTSTSSPALILAKVADTEVELIIATGMELYGAIRDQGVSRVVIADFEETRGWKLTEVTPKKAIFSKGDLTAELAVGQGVPPAAGSALSKYTGKSYNARAFKTRKAGSTATSATYIMDIEEVRWAVANRERVFTGGDVRFGSARDGLRVTHVRNGSIVAARGFKANDVVQQINNKSIKSLNDLRALTNDPAFDKPRLINVKVNRNGRTMFLRYSIPRPPPGR